MSTEEFEKVKATFLKQVADSLIINLDQTGIKLVPCGDWTMAAEGSRQVEVIGLGDKRQITATFSASLMVISCQCRFCTKGKLIAHIQSTSFQMDSTFFTRPITGLMKRHVFVFFRRSSFLMLTKSGKKLGVPSQKGMVLMDNFTGQTTNTVFEMVEQEGIVIVKGTTD